MDQKGHEALQAAAAAYANRTDQLRISDEELAGQLTMEATATEAACPRCGKPCPIGAHNSAHCTRCFSGFRVDAPEMAA